MTSRKGDRRAQRNFMAKELHRKQYQGRSERPKVQYDRKKLNDPIDDLFTDEEDITYEDYRRDSSDYPYTDHDHDDFMG